MQWLPMPERFWSKVAVGDPDACWLWTAARFTNGYGAFRLDGRQRKAHQIAYELTHGPVPAGKVLCHSCDVKFCCNVRHLWVGTQRENIEDRDRKGRAPRLIENLAGAPIAHGTQLHRSALTDDDVREMRVLRANGWLLRDLAARFNVTERAISYICKRVTWRHVE